MGDDWSRCFSQYPFRGDLLTLEGDWSKIGLDDVPHLEVYGGKARFHTMFQGG